MSSVTNPLTGQQFGAANGDPSKKDATVANSYHDPADKKEGSKRWRMVILSSVVCLVLFSGLLVGVVMENRAGRAHMAEYSQGSVSFRQRSSRTNGFLEIVASLFCRGGQKASFCEKVHNTSSNAKVLVSK